MITKNEILETNQMIDDANLDVRTITMGISLLDCADADVDRFNEKIYQKITTYAKDLVKVEMNWQGNLACRLSISEFLSHRLPLPQQVVKQILM